MTSPTRAARFTYLGLEVEEQSLVGHYDLDGRRFREVVTFEHVGDLREAAPRAVAELWYLIAGLSYYKAGAARHVDVGATPLGTHGRALLDAALVDGLGEFSVRNDLLLDDVTVSGGAEVRSVTPVLDPQRVLTPFGGGIDSVVSVTELNEHLDQALFVVSPPSGRFAPLEATAAVTGLDVVRATRHLDPQILAGDPMFYNGHVPVTAMVTLLACVAALSLARGGVVMSNEHSASAPNLVRGDREINHQWSKSWVAEQLIGAAVEERVGPTFCVASLLRHRSELWVAERFAAQPAYHEVFRSCNRAFTQRRDDRAATWCGECDKCLFIALVLAPFIERPRLRAIMASEPLSDPRREDQLRALVGLGSVHKPFECVGDPDESAVALTRVASDDAWRDVPFLRELARDAAPDRDADDLLRPQGPHRVPPHWLR